MLSVISMIFAAALTTTNAGPVAVPPRVSGVDQSPSNPSEYGKCTPSVERNAIATSHWCKFGKLGSYPEFPNEPAKKAFKFGRSTSYVGSIYAQKFACNVDGVGSNTHAAVAVSSKYLKSYQGGWTADKGACGKCMCISIFGGDDKYNKGLQKWIVDKYKGLSFMGKVSDRCYECTPDSIDILLDRPYSFAHVEPNNPNAWKVNRLDGYRGFKTAEVFNVGTWTSLWQFVPCDWDHKKCASFVASYGYKTRTPSWTKGVKP